MRVYVAQYKLINFPLAAPSSPPRNVSTTSVSSSSIGLTWLPPAEESRTGEIRWYNVIYTNTGTGTQTSVRSTNEQATLSGLEAFVMYNIRVAAYTVALGPSAELNVMTLHPSVCKVSHLF